MERIKNYLLTEISKKRVCSLSIFFEISNVFPQNFSNLITVFYFLKIFQNMLKVFSDSFKLPNIFKIYSKYSQIFFTIISPKFSLYSHKIHLKFEQKFVAVSPKLITNFSKISCFRKIFLQNFLKFPENFTVFPNSSI